MDYDVCIVGAVVFVYNEKSPRKVILDGGLEISFQPNY